VDKTSAHVIQTRQWLWRQSELGKVTESSSDIIFQLVGFKDQGISQLSLAMAELSKLLTERFNVTHQSFLVDGNNHTIEF
jgi:DNA/RNA-binding domain of Phe-tRNA-synthetase-like protein